MEKHEMMMAVKEFLQSVLSSSEFFDFKREIEHRKMQNLKPRKESRFILSVGGKLIDESESFETLIGLDWATEFTEYLGEAAEGFFFDVYGAERLEEVYENYNVVDFMDIDDIYDKLSDNASVELRAKANPWSHDGKPNPNDIVTMVYNFKSAEEYAVYLALEEVDNFRIEIEEGDYDPDGEEYEEYSEEDDFGYVPEGPIDFDSLEELKGDDDNENC